MIPHKQQDSNCLHNQTRIAVIGNVDSGKSTLIGVLTKGISDDGRGYARESILSLKHEKQTGRTTNISQEIMGFDQNHNQVLPPRLSKNKNKDWKHIADNSSRLINLIDLCGHEKYLKTTIYGMIALVPDYSFIVVGANMGLSKMTREHLGLSLFLKIPFAIIVTKTDLAPENILKQTIDDLKQIVKGNAISKIPVVLSGYSTNDEVDKWAGLMHGNSIVPIFLASNVTGQGMVQIKRFTSQIKRREFVEKQEDNGFQYDITEVFNVPGIGMVVNGLVKQGKCKVGQCFYLGPDKNNQYKVVAIKSIQIFRNTTDSCEAGDMACFQLKSIKADEKLERRDFRKGMMLVDNMLKNDSVMEFEANVHVLHHATTIGAGYQGVLHCGVVRQAARIVSIQGKDCIRGGDCALIRFAFQYSPEILRKNSIMVIREGRTRIFGIVTNLITKQQEQLEQQQLIEKS